MQVETICQLRYENEMMNRKIITSTERLILRTWDEADFDFAHHLWSDPEVMAFIDVRGGLSKEQVHDKLKAEIDCQEKNDIQYWPIFEKETGDFVGCCGLKPWKHSPRTGPELGFHLVKAKWGRGYANEAARGVIEYAFRVKRFEQLMVGHHPDNIPSKNILISLGFQFVENVFFKPTGLLHPSYELKAFR